MRGADRWSKGVLLSVVCLREYGREASILRKPWPIRGCCTNGETTDNIGVKSIHFLPLLVKKFSVWLCPQFLILGLWQNVCYARALAICCFLQELYYGAYPGITICGGHSIPV